MPTAPRAMHRQVRRLASLLSLALLLIEVSYAQTVTTIDDTYPFIVYSPVESWRANVVECDGCTNPPTSDAFGNSWHAGTHIIHTLDSDDPNPSEGDTSGGGGTTSSAATPTSTSQKPSVATSAAAPPKTAPSSTSTAPPASTSKAGDGDGGDDGDSDDEDSGKGKGKGGDKGKRSSWRKRYVASRRGQKAIEKRATGNPFETQGNDEDDPGFSDPPVTATVNFTGTAIYLYAILPLVPAPPQSTPTVTNVSFILDGAFQGEFRFIPDSTKPGTPTAASPIESQYIMHYPAFNTSGLEDTNHTLVMSLGVDSVFFFDYANITSGPGDNPGTVTATAPDTQRTGPSSNDLTDAANHKHDIATFAGAVGGSVGFLSVLALGLCISIRTRRRRAATRERRRNNAAYAQQFTARDHGDDGLEDDDEESAFGRVNAVVPVMMSQAGPTTFVPRYFPGSTPASPPPYVAEGESIPVPTMGILSASLNRAGNPVTIPSSTPMGIAIPPPMLDLQRTSTGSSYADRPPPTPPDVEAPIPIFGVSIPASYDVGNNGRNMNGGIVGPLPVDSPVADENEPMIGHSDDFDNNSRHSRHSSELRPSSIFSTSAGSHTHGGGSPYLPYNSGTSRTSSAPSPPPSPKPQSLMLPPGLYTLPLEGPSASTSMPSLPTPPSFTSSVAQSEQLNKPTMTGGPVSIPYPLLQPSRVPLPPSLYGYDVGSQSTLERHDSRT